MAAPLSFLILGTEWNSGHGGLSTLNRELCSALARLGHDVYCGIPEILPGELEAARHANVKLVTPRKVPGITGTNRLLLPFNGLPALDIVIGHGRVTGSEARAQVENFHPNARHAHFIHVDPRAIEPYKKRDKEAMVRADGYVSTEVELCKAAHLVVAVGPLLQKTFGTYLHPYRVPVHSFMPGLFADNPGASAPPIPTCLVFGRAADDELKGLSIAATAMGELATLSELSHCRFVVRGAEEGDEARLRTTLTEAGGAKLPLVVEPYATDRQVVLDAIRQATVVVLPSHQEGFGLSALEAISEGVPVIVSKNSGLARALEQHVPAYVDGMIVDVRDGADVLAQRLRNVLVESDAAFARAKALRDAMVPFFDWDQSAREFVDALLGRPSGPKSPTPSSPGGGSVIDAVAKTFAAASSHVLAWRQTLRANGEWIDRPEIDRILEYARNGGDGPLAVLSAPGGGKSALMARAAQKLVDENAIVLAIKADRIPADTDSIAKLGRELGLPSDLEAALAAAAGVRNTVLVIDQMDALADLVDVDTRRLDVLLELVERVAKDERIRVVLSCREFDFRHDVRMHRLQAEELVLASPDANKVNAILIAHGVEPSSLAPRTRALLDNLQALDVFLQVTPARRAQPGMDSYQKLVDALWNERLAGRQNRAALETAAEQLAGMMADREELWLTDAIVSTNGLASHVDELQAAGFLSRDGDRVAFSHQTFFEFARARHFLSEKQALPAYVRARQNGLFVRATLWTSLAYLRATDRQPYLDQLEDLWLDDTLRAHVHRLLVDFVGQVENPEPREALLLIPGLHDERWRAVTIEAMTGRPQWFERISDVDLPTLMSGPSANMVTALLAQAISFAVDTVVELVERLWLVDAARHHSIANILLYAPAWPPSIAKLAMAVAVGGTLDPAAIDVLINTAVNMSPETGAALVGVQLARLTVETQSKLKQAGEGERRSLYSDMLERAGRIRSMNVVAAEAPRAFVENVWPWFVSTIREIVHAEEPSLRYLEDYTLAASLESDFREFPQSLQEALAASAKQPGFLDSFVQQWSGESNMATHRFLAVTIETALPEATRLALDYLTADRRRLSIGDLSRQDGISVQLVRVLAPLLNEEERSRLEAAIQTSDLIAPALYEIESRRYAYDVNRRHRLRLMHALGEYASSSIQRLREQEERRFPQDDEVFDPNMREIKSPVSAAQMRRARNEDILHLFEILPDKTGHSHPSRSMEGGSAQAAQAFAEAAREDPTRFSQMLPLFTPGTSEEPVVRALYELAQKEPLVRLEALVFDLLRRGFFTKPEQQSFVAWAIERATRGGGRQQKHRISDQMRALLESWLVDGPDAPRKKKRPENEGEKTDVLLGTFGGGALPNGNYPILDALTTAYLDRDQPDFEGWMRVLENHLGRPEDPDVWLALSLRLHGVLWAPPDRAERFLNGLFELYPQVRDSRRGLTIIGRAISRLPMTTIKRWIHDLEAGDWERKEQAVGELLPWLTARIRSPSDLHERLAHEVKHGAEAMRRGIAYSAATLWHSRDRRDAATDLLVGLVPAATNSIAEAILSAFRVEPPLLDEPTRRLMRTLAEHPEVIASGKSFGFIETLRDLLPSAADIVAPTALALVRFSGAQAGHDFAWSHGEQLIDIAMTLQRLGQRYRDQGLDLFELLLAQNAFAARDVLAELDPTTRRGPVRAPRRVPRRPRQRRRFA